jgi:hypothetical protein
MLPRFPSMMKDSREHHMLRGFPLLEGVVEA